MIRHHFDRILINILLKTISAIASQYRLQSHSDFGACFQYLLPASNNVFLTVTQPILFFLFLRCWTDVGFVLVC